MNIEILSLEKLIDYKPEQRTHLIHIVSTSDRKDTDPYSPDKYLDLITYPDHIHRNIFGIDDVWKMTLPSGNPLFTEDEIKSSLPQYKNMFSPHLTSGSKLFDYNTATMLISEFRSNKDKVDNLAVQCTRGLNRSSAVAMALNEIFQLGHEQNQLIHAYSQANWYVYKVLLEAAKLMPELV